MPLSAYAVIGGTFLAGVMVGNWEPIKQLFLLTTFRRKNLTPLDGGDSPRGDGDFCMGEQLAPRFLPVGQS
jgi:hypothetical protein